MNTRLSADELDLLSHECEGKDLTIIDQGAHHGRRYTVAEGNQIILTLVTRRNGLVECHKNMPVEEALEYAAAPLQGGTNVVVDGEPGYVVDPDAEGGVEVRLTPDSEDASLDHTEVVKAAAVAVGVGENPDEDDDPLGHLPDLDELR
jgi:hypothetical protein